MTTNSKQKWNSLGNFLQAKEAKEKEEASIGTSSTPPVTPVTPVTDVPPVSLPPTQEDAAPRRDFARVANSVVRDAIPAGVFTGKCKQLYDYLYSRTRGAILPVRSARIPTDRVMKGAGMTRHTFRAHIYRLISFGLVEVEERPGEHGGNIYTVHIPGKMESKRDDTGDRGDRGHTGEKVQVVQGSQAHPGDRGLSSDYTTVSGESKTLYKTNTEQSDDDDAAARSLLRPIQKAVKVMTGRELSTSDLQNLTEVGEIIATEFQIAAARTTVNVPSAFLATHLRRRLFKKEKTQMLEESMLEEQATGDIRALSANTFTQEEISKCPDCGGSGWWYPEGEAKGVAKCKHEKLNAEN